MPKKSATVRYTAKQVKSRISRGDDQTDWAKIKSTSRATLALSIRRDPDDLHNEPDWTQAVPGLPSRKDLIKIRIDREVLAWFKQQGRGYQTLMNNVLRAFVESREEKRNSIAQ